jgi:uncharacterized membrane protein
VILLTIEQERRPVVKEFVNPNFHVALVHIPLGLLFTGVLIELFSFLGWRRGGFHAAGRWMILLGTLTAIPVAISGVYALADVSKVGLSETDAQLPWKDVVTKSPLVQDHEAWEQMEDHALVQSIATGVLVLVVLVWLSASDKWRARLYWPLLVILLTGVGMSAAGAWYAGEAVYTHGVGVQRGSHHERNDLTTTSSTVKTAAALQTEPSPTTSPATSPTTAPAGATTSGESRITKSPAHTTGGPTAGDESAGGSEQRGVKRGIEFYFPPMQVHVILAGIAIALAVAALGLAFRQSNVEEATAESLDGIAAALGPRSEDDPYLPAEQRRTLAEASAAVARRRGVPPARFWLLGCLLVLLTAGVGIYMFGSPHGINTYEPGRMWDEISDHKFKNPDSRFPVTRQLAHVIGGGSIFALMFLLAIMGRWAPRQRVLLTLLAIVLVAVVAAQVWLGILLLYDTTQGPITAFN